MRRKPTAEEICTFLEGRDPEERIVNIDYQYQDDFVKVVIRNKNDEKVYREEPFYPFVWATYEACQKLAGNNREALKASMHKYNIRCDRLSIDNIEGVPCEKMLNGYRFMFRAKVPMSYSKFLKFFKDNGNPIYSDNKNEEQGKSSNKGQYICVTPQEQYLISSGKRFFKGYDDYNDILRMTFDLETEGLDPTRHRIEWYGIRMNRKCWVGKERKHFVIEMQLQGKTKEEKDRSELQLIEKALSIIYSLRPDVITAHNGENFDWSFIIERCKQLGTTIEDVSAKYFNKKSLINYANELGITTYNACNHIYDDGFKDRCDKRGIRYYEARKKINGIRSISKNKRETTLKLGGEIEHFHQTIVPGIIITDSMHAVKRAQATDSNFKESNLKYATKYLKMVKPNRVYIPGDRISELSNDYEKHYAFNPTNGKWYEITESMPLVAGQGYEAVSGHYIVEQYLGDDLWECDKVEYALNGTDFMLAKIIPVPFSKCVTMGTAGQWKAIMLAWSYENGLAIPKPENTGKFTGGLSRLLRVGFVEGVIKLDYNSLYPSIILTWAISDDTDLCGAMLQMLEYVLTTREKHKGLKKAAGKVVDKYEKLINEGIELTPEQKAEYDQASNAFKIEDNRQMSVKKLGNSFFGSYGSNNGSVFPWKSLKCAERTTCTGRMALRLMISHFHGLGYEPIVGDTDGFNFKLPTSYRYTEDNPYIGLGKSRETKEGAKYTGYEADVAEFNDMYMCDMHYHVNAVNKMGLGIDEVVTSTINFSRKNYADYFPEKPYPEDVKMVGNTIKSKKMPEYIAKFLDRGIRLLLQNKGSEFLEEYYNYVEKIYNYQIPLKDIASKGKIKLTTEQYINDYCKTKTKAGRLKSRQAWMELAVREGLKVDMGDTLYYINTGKSQSQADVKKVSSYVTTEENGTEKNITATIERDYKKYRKENKERGVKDGMSKDEFIKANYPNARLVEEITLNAMLLPREMVESEKEFFCEEGKEYNAPKYIKQFNNRITPLLVCFSKSIRDKILIKVPSERPYFTAEEAVLTSGEPNNPSDQDTYEQLMTMEDKEIKFWATYPEFEIPYLKECGMNWDEIYADYQERMRKEKERGIDIVRKRYDEIVTNMTESDVEKLMDEGELPAGLDEIVDVDPTTGHFVSKQYPEYEIGSILDILESMGMNTNDYVEDEQLAFTE